MRQTVFVVLVVTAILFTTAPATAQSVDLIFPQIAVGGGYVTTITLIHNDRRSTSSATGTLSFFNQDGSARTVTSTELGTGSSFPITVPYEGVTVVTLTSDAGTVVGMGRYSGTGVAVQGVATFRFGDAVVGGLAADQITNGFIPLETAPGFSTGVAIVNPGTAPINLTLNLRNAAGDLVQSASPDFLNPLGPSGHVAKFVNEFGFASVPSDGTVEIQVNGAGTFAALSLYLANELLSSSGVIAPITQSSLIFPQIADGGNYTTTTRLLNPGTSTFTGTIRYFNQDGTSRNIAIEGRGTASSFDLSIPPKGTATLKTTGAGTLSVGSARVETLTPLGGVSVIVFGQTHIGVPSTTPMRSGRIAVDTVNGNTGFALAGSGQGNASIALTLQDRNGLGAETVMPAALNPLNTNGQLAVFVDQVGFTDTTNRPDSSMRIVATSGNFAPLVLLERNGNYSSAAIAREITVDPQADWAGSFTGTWTNTTFSSTGGVSLTNAVDVPSNTATVTIDLGGGVFGGSDPAPETFTAPMTPNGFQVTTTSTLFGDWTLTITPDGALSIRAPNVPSAFIATFSMDGTFTPGSGYSGTYEVGFPTGTPAVGIWSAN